MVVCSLTRVPLVCWTRQNSFCCLSCFFVFPAHRKTVEHSKLVCIAFFCCCNRYVLCYCSFPSIVPSCSSPVVLEWGALYRAGMRQAILPALYRASALRYMISGLNSAGRRTIHGITGFQRRTCLVTANSEGNEGGTVV